MSENKSFSSTAGLRPTDLQSRFLAIWVALGILLLVGVIFLPRSLQPSAMLSILPFAAFLAIAAAGQALVIMVRGIDLSVPAIVTLSSSVLLGVSGGADDRLGIAIISGVAAAAIVGFFNGFFVAVLKLNALIVTLAVGAIVSGLTLWYRQGLPAEATVPRALSDFGEARFLSINSSVWIAVVLVLLITFVLRKTLAGRNFEAVGSNPGAARASGLRTTTYEAGGYIAAALLYGVVGILLSGFIRNPTLEVGNQYLLAPIAAAVLGATSISGGMGSMIAVFGASLFLIQLDQMLKLMGLATSYQLIIQGGAIALGMWLSSYIERRTSRLSISQTVAKVPPA